MSTHFDKETQFLLGQLGPDHPNKNKLKHFIKEQEFDYGLIIDDIQGPPDQSDILEVVGKNLYFEIKSLICCTNDQHLSDLTEETLPLSLELSRDINHPFYYDQQSPNLHLSDTSSDFEHDFVMLDHDDEKQKHFQPQIQNLLDILQQLPNKEGLNILQQFLLEQNYESIEAIKEDIEDQANSIIFEQLENHNIDITFFSAFCSKVREIDNQCYIHNAILVNDEWSVILQRMMQNVSFSNKIYQSIVDYFRHDEWTVESYQEDEIGAEYESSFFHDIFPEMQDCQRRKLIKIFEDAIINKYIITPQAPAQIAHNVVVDNAENKQNNMLNSEAVEAGNVCDENHPRYKKIERVIDRCAEMVRPRSNFNGPNQDYDLKALCSVFNINQVLEISDILCRQYLIALYHSDEIECNNLLREISSNPAVVVMLEKFSTKTYWKKQHNEKKFSLYFSNTLNVLMLKRYLGYSTPPISRLSLYIPNQNKPALAKLEINKLKCNARDVQIYVFAFLISCTRMLIKNFENTNVTVILDMKFPVNQYENDEGTMSCVKLREQSMRDLQSKIIKFAEPFENPLVRSTVKEKIEKQHCMMVHSIDFNKTKNTRGRWNNLKPKLCAVNKRYVGFQVNEVEYMQLFDACELFQLCRVKKYLMDETISSGHRYSRTRDRLCISLHKFGNRLKFYLHFEESVFRIRVEDLCEWFPFMFDEYDSALKWDQMEHVLSNALRDNEKLADITHCGVVNGQHGDDINGKVNENIKTNFWRNIHKWSDLDKEFYRKCDKFTYEMKKKYSLQYEQYVFDKNIVDKCQFI